MRIVSPAAIAMLVRVGLGGGCWGVVKVILGDDLAKARGFAQLFPRTRIDPRKNTEGEFETTARGYRLGTSVGGTLTGRGGSLILIDDPLKPAEALSELAGEAFGRELRDARAEAYRARLPPMAKNVARLRAWADKHRGTPPAHVQIPLADSGGE